MLKTDTKTIYGDFQTPPSLAELMMDILDTLDFSPNCIIEPTCGVGEILMKADNRFHPKLSFGVEINPEYVNTFKAKINGKSSYIILNGSIFDYLITIEKQSKSFETILLVGNPPWVTNSEIGAMNGNNLPRKYNIKGLKGIDAITGKSNFDIGEYILWKLIEIFHQKNCVFAFLCKTIVARNLLKLLWDNAIQFKDASIYPIDSKKYFNAAVDACFFVINFSTKLKKQTCCIFNSIENRVLDKKYGYFNQMIINNYDFFSSHNYFGTSDYIWRNGVKHDCSKVMELKKTSNEYINGYGEIVNIESDLIFPLYKSSDLSKHFPAIKKYVIITQKSVGEDTSYIKYQYPSAWLYLNKYYNSFVERKSSIYKNKPPFSIFSIGEYSFSPYKIAISSLYKKILFHKISSIENKIIMVDDTCNFISCYSSEEADFVHSLLSSDEVCGYLNSVIFWDNKRPITIELLNRLDLLKVSIKLGLENMYHSFVRKNKVTKKNNNIQLNLF
ncbi:MAG: SAM-dependent DNA methyltransferase [Desulfobacterales bacterium]|nr:SAM-dependent DNA methyltransferase [Desulfobacterales bacterium]